VEHCARGRQTLFFNLTFPDFQFAYFMEFNGREPRIRDSQCITGYCQGRNEYASV
jgi:hypothetical protein